MKLLYAVLLITSVILIAGCTKREAPKSDEQSTAPAGVSGKVADILSVETRAPKAPNFSWKDSTGATITFDSFRGKLTVINFWATWCGPCRKEMPDLIALSHEYASKNVRFLGVAEDRGVDVADVVRTYVSEHNVPYQNLLGNDEMDDAFGNPRAIPTTFIVDAGGNIVQTLVGMRTKEFYARAIDNLLK